MILEMTSLKVYSTLISVPKKLKNKKYNNSNNTNKYSFTHILYTLGKNIFVSLYILGKNAYSIGLLLVEIHFDTHLIFRKQI